jgi:hypothetical protein
MRKKAKALKRRINSRLGVFDKMSLLSHLMGSRSESEHNAHFSPGRGRTRNGGTGAGAGAGGSAHGADDASGLEAGISRIVRAAAVAQARRQSSASSLSGSRSGRSSDTTGPGGGSNRSMASAGHLLGSKSIVPSATNFDPVLFLSLVHGEHSFSALQTALPALEQALERQVRLFLILISPSI